MSGSLLRSAAAALALLLSACASFAPQPTAPGSASEAAAAWQRHRRDVAAISAFTLDGRAANSLGVKADLRWRQHADGTFDARIAGPLGAGAAALSGNPRHVEIRTANGVEASDDPEAWMLERAGWTLPLRGLRWWALGLPAPGSPAHTEVDGQGRLALLEQNGWTLLYTEYMDVDGMTLPKRFEASNEQIRLKLLIDRWQDVLKSAPADRH